MSCDEPVALFMHKSIIVRDSFGNCGHVCFPKRSELYCGLFNDCLPTICFSFSCFLVRVWCRRKKFTFAISSADEFLVDI